MKFLEGEKTWFAQRLPLVEDRIRNRLGELSSRLADADWLDGAFSAGDLLMAAVLLRLKASRMLDEYPNLSAYIAPGRSAARLQACFRRSIGGFHRQATDRLMKVSSWLT
jgi:glutathione S-transferase